MKKKKKLLNIILIKENPLKQASSLALDPEEYTDTFFVPELARWSHIKNLHQDIGAELNKATEAIEEHKCNSRRSYYHYRF